MLIALLLTLVQAQATPAAAPSPLWGDLQRGPHAVGFRIVPFAAGALHVWYPASHEAGDAIRFGEYLRLSRDLERGIDRSTDDELLLQRTLAVAVTGKEDSLTKEQAMRILALPMVARRNAEAASGSFPVVLWTHRPDTTAAQSVVSEFLASHGVVVVFASEVSPPRPPFALDSEEKKKELQRQVARLRTALSAARTLPFVQPGPVGVMAWSYAGESAYALQQAERDVAVVVGFSTNLLGGWVYQPEALESTDPATVDTPYVIITEPRNDGSHKPSERLLEGASAPVFIISLPKMKHGGFNVLEGMAPAVVGITSVQPWSLAGPDAKLGYEVAAQYARRALDHYLFAAPTKDTPFPLWGPTGEIPEGFVGVETSGKPRPAPTQPTFTPVEFRSDDDLTVNADLYPLADKKAPVIVLVHQSGASRGEYRQIAPRLNRMGFSALAIDSRWGNVDRWNGVENETAKRYGTAAIVASGDREKIRAIDRAADLRAAVRWVKEHGYSGPIILWGSSITANAVLSTAVASADGIAAIAAFSPGEYNREHPSEVQATVSKLKVPVLIACGEDEGELCAPIFRALPKGHKFFYRAWRGRHGSSILLDDPENWKPVEQFLRPFVRR